MRPWAVGLLTLLLSGCLAADEAPAEAAAPDAGDAAVGALAPRDVSAFRETNRTEGGLGGMDHAHDYWKGQDRALLFHDWVYLAPYPLLREEGGPSATSLDLTLPAPGLVYEGATSVEFLAAATSLTGGPDPYPAPAMRVEYLTAADGPGAWRDGGALVVGTPTVVAVAAEETDMPHSTASLWQFRVIAAGPHAFAVNLSVTAVRGADAPTWPGHPEFYADAKKRLVFDADASNREVGLVARYYVFGDDRDWRFPDKVVSWGTGHLEVFVNITAVDAPVPPDSAYLRVRNATQVYDDFEVYFDDSGPEDLEDYHFVVPVDPAGMDSPYAPGSRWAFSLAVGYQRNAGAVFPSRVDYHMTIWAHAAEDPDDARAS